MVAGSPKLYPEPQLAHFFEGNNGVFLMEDTASRREIIILIERLGSCKGMNTQSTSDMRPNSKFVLSDSNTKKLHAIARWEVGNHDATKIFTIH